MVKLLLTMQEIQVQSLGWEDPLEKEMAIHSSTLAWKIPWMEERGRLQSMGSQRVGHNWATSHSLSISIMYCTKHDAIHKSRNDCAIEEFEIKAGNTNVQFSSVAQLCLTLCNPVKHSTPILPVHPQLLEFNQAHVHWVGEAIQPSHSLSSPSPPALNLS